MSQTTEKMNHKFRMITQLSDQKLLVNTVCIWWIQFAPHPSVQRQLSAVTRNSINLVY